MSQPFIDQLSSPDPAQRKQAIVALAKTKDHSVLQALADVYHNDPVPEIRELALKAGRYVQQTTQSTTAQHQPPTPITSARPKSQTPKGLPPKPRKKADSGGRFLF